MSTLFVQNDHRAGPVARGFARPLLGSWLLLLAWLNNAPPPIGWRPAASCPGQQSPGQTRTFSFGAPPRRGPLVRLVPLVTVTCPPGPVHAPAHPQPELLD